jgi:hypothetical protein
MTLTWELDFYSRPLVDEGGKKVWEVVICESAQTIHTEPTKLLRYCQYCPSTQVNSVWLQNAIEAAIAQSGQAPTQIRFFRRQMANMITKACKDLGLDAKLSRRALTLYHWLQERYATVYPQQPGYQAAPNPSVQYTPEQPNPLPDALRGDRWAFLSLPVADFADMEEWEIGFGEGFPLGQLGLGPQDPVPGLVIYSQRAAALAGWMSGLELGFLMVEGGSPGAGRLVLETGGSDRWLLSNLTKGSLWTDAQKFATAKAQVKNVHFLAIQENPTVEAFAGFWLLQQVDW